MMANYGWDNEGFRRWALLGSLNSPDEPRNGRPIVNCGQCEFCCESECIHEMELNTGGAVICDYFVLDERFQPDFKPAELVSPLPSPGVRRPGQPRDVGCGWMYKYD